MKYLWTHAVCLTDFWQSQLLCPKILATFPLSGDFRLHARQPRNRSSFTNVHFWTCKYMDHITILQILFFNNPNKIFWWFLKFVYLNVYSIAWIPIWGDLCLSVDSFTLLTEAFPLCFSALYYYSLCGFGCSRFVLVVSVPRKRPLQTAVWDSCWACVLDTSKI